MSSYIYGSGTSEDYHNQFYVLGVFVDSGSSKSSSSGAECYCHACDFCGAEIVDYQYISYNVLSGKPVTKLIQKGEWPIYGCCVDKLYEVYEYIDGAWVYQGDESDRESIGGFCYDGEWTDGNEGLYKFGEGVCRGSVSATYGNDPGSVDSYYQTHYADISFSVVGLE